MSGFCLEKDLGLGFRVILKFSSGLFPFVDPFADEGMEIFSEFFGGPS